MTVDEAHAVLEPVPVASAELLFRMKRDTVRPQDRVDAERIRQAFDLEDA